MAYNIHRPTTLRSWAKGVGGKIEKQPSVAELLWVFKNAAKVTRKDKLPFMDFGLHSIKRFNKQVLTCIKYGNRGHIDKDCGGFTKCRGCRGAHTTKNCPLEKQPTTLSHKRAASSELGGTMKLIRIKNSFTIMDDTDEHTTQGALVDENMCEVVI